jgi:hypothetical protein
VKPQNCKGLHSGAVEQEASPPNRDRTQMTRRHVGRLKDALRLRMCASGGGHWSLFLATVAAETGSARDLSPTGNAVLRLLLTMRPACVVRLVRSRMNAHSFFSIASKESFVDPRCSFNNLFCEEVPYNSSRDCSHD